MSCIQITFPTQKVFVWDFGEPDKRRSSVTSSMRAISMRTALMDILKKCFQLQPILQIRWRRFLLYGMRRRISRACTGKLSWMRILFVYLNALSAMSILHTAMPWKFSVKLAIWNGDGSSGKVLWDGGIIYKIALWYKKVCCSLRPEFGAPKEVLLGIEAVLNTTMSFRTAGSFRDQKNK